MDRPDDAASPWDMLRRSTSPLHPRFRRLEGGEPPAGLPHGFTLGTPPAPGNDWSIFAEEANARGRVGSDHRVVILYEPATAEDAERFAASLATQLFDGRLRLILCGVAASRQPTVTDIDVSLDPRPAGEIDVPPDADTVLYLAGRCVLDPLALERICRMTRTSPLIVVPLVEATARPGQAVSAPAAVTDWPAERPYRAVRGLNIAVSAALVRHVGRPLVGDNFAHRCYEAGAYFVPVFVPELSGNEASGADAAPRTSVIVDARRRGWGVGRTVSSLLAQSQREIEICVWGGGLAASLYALYWRSSHTVRGIKAAALGDAIAATNGDFVGLIEAGDAIGTDLIADTVAHLENRADLGAVRIRKAARGESQTVWRRLGSDALLPMPEAPQLTLFRRSVLHRRGWRGDVKDGSELLRELAGLAAVETRRSPQFKPILRPLARIGRKPDPVERAKAELVMRGLDRYWDPASPADRLVRKPDTRLVVFWPDYSKSNVYQRLLYGAGNRDTEYVSGTIDVALGAARSLREHVVFHLHWTNRIFRLSDDDAVVGAEAAAFLDQLRQFKELGGTVAWTIHNIVSHDTKHHDAEIAFAKTVIELADRVHLHSALSVDEVEDHFAIPREKLRIARHGNYLGAYADFVPRDVARRDLGLDADDDVLLFTGSLRRYKGLDTLITAFERMLPLHPSLRLVLAGATREEDPPLLDGLSDAARARVLLVDRFLDNDELQLYFRAADAGVYPYDEVLTSGSIMLAQSFGLPVVAPDFGMISEAIGEAGLLYGRTDPAGLQAALDRMLAAKRSGAIETMRAAAVAAAQRNSWQPFARTVLD